MTLPLKAQISGLFAASAGDPNQDWAVAPASRPCPRARLLDRNSRSRAGRPPAWTCCYSLARVIEQVATPTDRVVAELYDNVRVRPWDLRPCRDLWSRGHPAGGAQLLGGGDRRQRALDQTRFTHKRRGGFLEPVRAVPMATPATVPRPQVIQDPAARFDAARAVDPSRSLKRRR